MRDDVNGLEARVRAGPLRDLSEAVTAAVQYHHLITGRQLCDQVLIVGDIVFNEDHLLVGHRGRRVDGLAGEGCRVGRVMGCIGDGTCYGCRYGTVKHDSGL